MKLIPRSAVKLVVMHDLTSQHARRLLDRLAALPMKGVVELTLSLKGARQIDVSGVAVLVRLRSWAGSVGTTLRIVDVRPEVDEFLARLGLASALKIRGPQPTRGDSIAVQRERQADNPAAHETHRSTAG